MSLLLLCGSFYLYYFQHYSSYDIIRIIIIIVITIMTSSLVSYPLKRMPEPRYPPGQGPVGDHFAQSQQPMMSDYNAHESVEYPPRQRVVRPPSNHVAYSEMESQHHHRQDMGQEAYSPYEADYEYAQLRAGFARPPRARMPVNDPQQADYGPPLRRPLRSAHSDRDIDYAMYDAPLRGEPMHSSDPSMLPPRFDIVYADDDEEFVYARIPRRDVAALAARAPLPTRREYVESEPSLRARLHHSVQSAPPMSHTISSLRGFGRDTTEDSVIASSSAFGEDSVSEPSLDNAFRISADIWSSVFDPAPKPRAQHASSHPTTAFSSPHLNGVAAPPSGLGFNTPFDFAPSSTIGNIADFQPSGLPKDNSFVASIHAKEFKPGTRYLFDCFTHTHMHPRAHQVALDRPLMSCLPKRSRTIFQRTITVKKQMSM
jgi:hypothetical protein